jgi:hypothetical protein
LWPCMIALLGPGEGDDDDDDDDDDDEDEDDDDDENVVDGRRALPLPPLRLRDAPRRGDR